jgi:hypothetical protein
MNAGGEKSLVAGIDLGNGVWGFAVFEVGKVTRVFEVKINQIVLLLLQY